MMALRQPIVDTTKLYPSRAHPEAAPYAPAVVKAVRGSARSRTVNKGQQGARMRNRRANGY